MPNSTVMANKKPLLPLTLDRDQSVLDKNNSITYELRTDPREAASAKYKLTVRVLEGNESVRAIINWKRDVERVLHGLNVTEGKNMSTMTQTLMRGTPLNIYTSSVMRLAEAAKEA